MSAHAALIPAPKCPRNHILGPVPARPGLTLVEVLAVVVILGLIAATLTLSFRGQVGTAKRQLAKTGIGVIVNAVETFALETGRVPTMDEGLNVLTVAAGGRREGLLKPDKLLDPWRTPYAYVTPGPRSLYQVISYGGDQLPGGAAGSEAADITSDDLGEAGQAPTTSAAPPPVPGNTP